MIIKIDPNSDESKSITVVGGDLSAVDPDAVLERHGFDQTNVSYEIE